MKISNILWLVVLLMFVSASCVVHSAPVPTYPKEKIIGTWEYQVGMWPGVMFTLTLRPDNIYKWEGVIEEGKVWDWSSGTWTYDGRHLYLWNVRAGMIIHSSSNKDMLKCHYINDFSGARVNERINLYRRK